MKTEEKYSPDFLKPIGEAIFSLETCRAYIVQAIENSDYKTVGLLGVRDTIDRIIRTLENYQV